VDSQGVPLEGPYTLIFRLYNAETAGTKAWEETQTNVPISKGHFSVLLGQVTPLTSVNWGSPCWLSVQVGTEPELSPRQRITSVPLAIRAETAEQLTTPTALRSNVVNFSRTAVAGSGTQSIIGLGFKPTALSLFCTVMSANIASWGMGDEGGDKVTIENQAGTFDSHTEVIVNLSAAGNAMNATLVSLDADGFTLQWTKFNAGYNATCGAMGVR
jgi:hypothetical protein